MPPRKWTEQQSETFWEDRTWHIIERDDGLEQEVTQYETSVQSHESQEMESFQRFEEKFQNMAQSPEAETFCGLGESEDLLFWMTHSSWTKCQDCQSLQANKLFPSYRKRPVVKPVKNCGCSRNRYIVPKIDEIQ
ncbi:hypothetical protein OS493_019938 [Desmophyllum pertusum]|uniref:Uncharacterized protein n=1 Tax=Desmophyllum pertusum TaxID=174260 RepID=A0A9W9YN23_9CNID|nr:hypothetical protein OS493_019938 [Desmophyllum pertusum]